jgi:hypothetical protein
MLGHMNACSASPDPSRALQFEIRVRGQLGPEWAEWFGGLAVTPMGGDDTLLAGVLVDQAALYGVLKKVRDLGLPLLSVNCVEPCADPAGGGAAAGGATAGEACGRATQPDGTEQES